MNKKLNRGVFFLLLVILIPVFTTRFMNSAGGIAERSAESEKCYIISGQEKIPLEEYLTGAVAYYMPPDYEDEAYKTMAVLLRTYVIGQMGEDSEIKEEQLTISRCSMEEMEVAFGEQFLHTYSRYQRAVNATRGELASYDGKLIEPYFHQVSAGTTNSLNGYPYLKAVDSSQDIQAKNYLSLLTVPVEEFVSGLLKAADAKEDIFWKTGTTAEELMSQITFHMREGDYVQSVVWQETEIKAVKIQEAFSLPSTAFRFEAYEGNIRIMTKGLGHGIGLSLYGAARMAEEGKNYREILTYYYTNITVSGE
ncbi:MAG: SpoIID/LytB domain-containing protein [Lachnospiraceae bacterium]|nr:SpoIID/LytB domain-containing protein [Lachnospiraceae bacterium]